MKTVLPLKKIQVEAICSNKDNEKEFIKLLKLCPELYIKETP
tara:strand:+ start:1393 stop:1518 length:126 start_codon:yes stop_codon:yes gene_type:complete